MTVEIRDKINSITLDDTKSAPKKQRLINAVHCQAALSFVENRLPLSFSRGKYEVTILDAKINNDGMLHLKLSCKVNGAEALRDQDFIWNRVPLLVQDDAGDVDIGGRIFREDLVDGLQSTIIQAIKKHAVV